MIRVRVANRFRGTRLLSPWAALVLPAAWVLGEFVRALVTSIVFWGEGGLIGPYWNLGAFGFAASGTPAVFSGRFVGLAGLSFLVVAVNVFLFWLLLRRWRAALIGLCSVVAVATLGWLAYRTPDGAETKVGIVHMNSTDPINETALRGYVASHQPFGDLNVLVLPEYSGLYTETSQTGAQEPLESFAFGNRSGLVIAAGYGRGDDSNRVGQIGYYADDQTISLQQKRFLIPAGEYLPESIASVIKLSDSPILLPRYNEARKVTPGRQPERPVTYSGRTYGTLSCSGVLTPQFYRSLTKQGAEILVNPTSLIIFADSRAFSDQNRQMARYQAVANARPFIQSARGASSFVLDHNGRTVQQSRADLEIAAATVSSNRTPTAYTLVGEWVVPASAVILVWWFLNIHRSSRRRGGRRKRTTQTD